MTYGLIMEGKRIMFFKEINKNKYIYLEGLKNKYKIKAT